MATVAQHKCHSRFMGQPLWWYAFFIRMHLSSLPIIFIVNLLYIIFVLHITNKNIGDWTF